MSGGLTLQQWRDRLANYLTSEAKILESQEYQVGGTGTGRRNRRADLEAVQAGIKECRTQIAQIESSTNTRTRRVFRLRPY